MARKETRTEDDQPRASRASKAQDLIGRLPTPPIDGNSEASFVQMAGTTCMALGALLVVLSGLVEPIANLGKMLGSVGMGGGTLVLSGLTLFVLGRLRRSHMDLSQQAEDRASNDQLLEQMAAEVVQLESALDQVKSGQSRVRGDIRELGETMQTMAQAQASKNDEGDKAQDAIFRLAASLDQLGAKVEQRMHTQYEAFRARLREVGDDIARSQQDLRQLMAEIPEQIRAAQPAPAPEPARREPPAPQPRQERHELPSDMRATAIYEAAMNQQFADPEPPPPSPSENGAVFGEVMERNPYETPSATGLPRQTPSGSPLDSLGFLDSIPDEPPSNTHAPAPSAPPASASPTPEPRAPLPEAAAHQAPQIDMGAFGPDQNLVREKSPVERAAELDTRTKLHRLNDLLEDRSLREMLENIKRGE